MAESTGLVGRVGRYLCHDEIGAEMLAGAGGDALDRLGQEHHLPPERWTVATEVGAVLKVLDDDWCPSLRQPCR